MAKKHKEFVMFNKNGLAIGIIRAYNKNHALKIAQKEYKPENYAGGFKYLDLSENLRLNRGQIKRPVIYKKLRLIKCGGHKKIFSKNSFLFRVK
ncbi:MAG: hypothetical protein JKY33_10710 [Bacteroidia bacterium]|nr:hypothetical protein [Bacteroidia bacterium]